MQMYKEPINPLQDINMGIYDDLVKFPYTFQEIINVVLRTAMQINEAFDPQKNPYYYYMCPIKEGANIGGCYENGIRHRLNGIGKLHFEEGEHNVGEDCTCVGNPEYSIEIKTRQNLQFNNTNDNGRTHESTKYQDGEEDKDHYYILVQHNVDFDSFPYTTKVKRIFFGKLSKADFRNPNGTGAAYLIAERRKRKCIEIWNDKVGNTIDHYNNWCENDL